MPVKRSINLMLVDENKISPLKAIPGIILIVLAAALFSKYMVADRLIAMSQASGQVASLQSDLKEATQALEQYEGIEDKYAHLTYAGMTQEELGRVDRVRVLQLVSEILPEGDTVRSWSVNSNILTVDITGSSLQYLNELARRIEESPIVDVCAISTAKKNKQAVPATFAESANQSLADALESRRQQVENGLADFMLAALTNVVRPFISEQVDARFTIYLRQPSESELEAPDEAEDASGEPAEMYAHVGKPRRSTRSLDVELEEVTAP